MTPREARAQARTIVTRPYARIFIPEELGGYSCGIGEFPGCYSQGETLASAARHLESAMVLWVQVSLELGHTIPEPADALNFDSALRRREASP